jgi:hypothetical protein
MDLFAATAHFERVPISGGEALYLPHLDLAEPAEEILRKLISVTPWRQENVVVWEKNTLSHG